ncbi:TPA: hypothetical protein ACPTLY_005072, partial [Escherichia coli]
RNGLTHCNHLRKQLCNYQNACFSPCPHENYPLFIARACGSIFSHPRYFIRTPYNGVLASQTRHDYCPQSSMIRGVMSPGLVGRW